MELVLTTPVYDFDGKQAKQPVYKMNEEKTGYEIESEKDLTIGMVIKGALNVPANDKAAPLTIEDLLKRAKLLNKINSGTEKIKLSNEEAGLITKSLHDGVKEKTITVFVFLQIQKLIDPQSLK